MFALSWPSDFAQDFPAGVPLWIIEKVVFKFGKLSFTFLDKGLVLPFTTHHFRQLINENVELRASLVVEENLLCLSADQKDPKVELVQQTLIS